MRSYRWVFAAFLAGCGAGAPEGAPPAPARAELDAGAGADAAPGAGDGAPDAGLAPSDAGPAPDAGASDAAGPTRTTLRIHYPASAHNLTVRGSGGPLTWSQGVAAARAGDVATLAIEALAAPIEWKVMLDDATWSRGPNYRARPGETVDVYPRFTTVKGRVAAFRTAFASQALPGATRGIWAYLPPSYDENTTARFPVVYMQDGGNLFDPARAFGGNEWKVDETLDAAAEDGSIREAIVIGVEATAARIPEYTPVPDPGHPEGGRADAYLAMLAGEIKPLVDAELRTLPGRETTALAGSSLGGLVSAYAGVRRPEVFGLVAALSPSTWWAGRAILGEVASVPQRPARALKVYVDSGDGGGSGDDVTNTRALAAAYVQAGYVEGQTLRYVVQPGATHSEVYWAQRFPGALAFLLGPRDP